MRPSAVSDPALRAGTVLDIDLAAIVENWRSLASRVRPAQCAAVVKADAYGLGAAPVALALARAGCALFFVATAEEGIALRAALPEASEIAVLNGPPRGCAAEVAEHRLIPVLNDPGQIAEWAELGAERGGFPAMLHIDTGMARLGLSERQLAELEVAATAPPCWRAVLSHLGCADTPAHPLNRVQHARFTAALTRYRGVSASFAASSGIFLGPDFHFDLVRPGAALYGVNPQPSGPNPMRPVVRLRARILQTRCVDSGESVGYGAAHSVTEPTRIATVAIGYADGWLRSLSQRGCGFIGGARVPLIGRVSMDLTVFDVSAIDPAVARPGEFIELLGPGYGVDEAARDAGTIGYEMLTALGRRHHRIYHEWRA
ncbi:MAG: alanine racemase [Alphaproteobacteria bacterium]|nr:alanine racemase [Alphaproteobacteria bacterium]